MTNTDRRGWLRLTFIPDEYDYPDMGRLIVEVSCNGFAGYGAEWHSPGSVAHFADQLMLFPLSSTSTAVLGKGSLASALESSPDISITALHSIYCSHPALRVILRAGNIRSDYSNEIQVELLTEYESLRRFSQAIRGLLRGDIDEAVLYVENNAPDPHNPLRL